MIQVKSTSKEGVYYLVNGWRKHKKIWIDKADYRTTFKDLRSAKTSVTKLLKIFDEFKDDVIEFVEI